MNVLTTIQDKDIETDVGKCKYQTLLCLRLFQNVMLIKLGGHVDRFRQVSRQLQVVQVQEALRSLNRWSATSCLLHILQSFMQDQVNHGQIIGGRFSFGSPLKGEHYLQKYVVPV